MDKKELQALLDEVAGILGGTALAVHDWTGYIDLPEINKLARIFFRVDGKKLWVSGHTTLSGENKYWLPSRADVIGISWARGAAVIAKEIQSRFLPEYTEWIDEAATLIAESDARDAILHARANVIREIIGDNHSYEHANFTFHGYDRERGLSTSGGVNSVDVTLEMRVTFEEAKTILRMINKGRKNA
ncbi:hypothetical protein [Castellaniella sp.]|uniref:hypothetical protein n=1 Tax=Castellaniella sp. TaxID=1955812 RepID=UPI002AFFD481|nr:hypothetical protein [Castellaniella sp.]